LERTENGSLSQALLFSAADPWQLVCALRAE
jgi:hypothetical protein